MRYTVIYARHRHLSFFCSFGEILEIIDFLVGNSISLSAINGDFSILGTLSNLSYL